jgi:4-hydroxy-3-methylbut-2-en-1-yl diphosphate reductase
VLAGREKNRSLTVAVRFAATYSECETLSRALDGLLKKLLLAGPRCCCAGVDRAVQIVELCLDRFGAPVFVRKEIVHNRHIVNSLTSRGAVFVDELTSVPDGSTVVFSAHGVSPAVHAEAADRSLRVIDATCPLVSKVHLEVLRFAAEGYHILLIGRKGHEEVDGTMGHSPERITLIEDVEQARGQEIPEQGKLVVLTQTTLSVDDTENIVAALRERFDHLEFPPTEDICYATQNRQNAVKAMCERGAELLLVVGSENSSNAARLVEAGETRGVSGRLIDGPDEIDPSWFAGVAVVGLTGGASTPDAIVQSVVVRLKDLGVVDEVEQCITAVESTVFQLPVSLRETNKDPLACARGSDGEDRS